MLYCLKNPAVPVLTNRDERRIRQSGKKNMKQYVLLFSSQDKNN